MFVFLAAFEAGMDPQTVMRDSPFILEGWQPKNYSGTYAGSLTLEQAFARSINTVPPYSIILPSIGTLAISFLPTPARSRRRDTACCCTTAATPAPPMFC